MASVDGMAGNDATGAHVTGADAAMGRAVLELRHAVEASAPSVPCRTARAVADELGSRDVNVGVTAYVTNEANVTGAFAAAVLAFDVDLVVSNSGLSISRPLPETTIEDGNMQHDVMAGGSFLVSREAARGSGIFAGGWGPVDAGVAAAFVR